jgi:RNA polymerase sigma factor (sigma-70 family)
VAERSGGEIALSKGSDAELGAAVERAQGGDEAAFTVVYRLVDPLLLNYVRSIVGPADTEDVTSEAWLEIARDLGRFRGDGAGFRGWAATIARHRALDHLRWQRSRPRVTLLEQDVLELPGGEDTAAEALERLSISQALALIATLPPDQAEAVLLRVLVGLDAVSAGRVLGKRPGAVRTASYRGLKGLSRLLGDP